MYRNTILSIRDEHNVVIIGNTIIKTNIDNKNNYIYIGFSGSTSDAMALNDRLNSELYKYVDLSRACVELANHWKRDKYLRKLDAMMIVVDRKNTFIVSSGDVLIPEDGIAAIGYENNYVFDTAKTLMCEKKNMSIINIAKETMNITLNKDMFVDTTYKIYEIFDIRDLS